MPDLAVVVGLLVGFLAAVLLVANLELALESGERRQRVAVVLEEE